MQNPIQNHFIGTERMPQVHCSIKAADKAADKIEPKLQTKLTSLRHPMVGTAVGATLHPTGGQVPA